MTARAAANAATLLRDDAQAFARAIGRHYLAMRAHMTPEERAAFLAFSEEVTIFTARMETSRIAHDTTARAAENGAPVTTLAPVTVPDLSPAPTDAERAHAALARALNAWLNAPGAGATLVAGHALRVAAEEFASDLPHWYAAVPELAATADRLLTAAERNAPATEVAQHAADVLALVEGINDAHAGDVFSSLAGRALADEDSPTVRTGWR